MSAQIASPKLTMASRTSARPMKPSKARAVFRFETSWGYRWASVPRTMLDEVPYWWQNVEAAE